MSRSDTLTLRSPARRFAGLLRGESLRLVAAAALAASETAAGLAAPLLAKLAMDDILSGPGPGCGSKAAMLAVAMAALALARAACGFAGGSLVAAAGAKIVEKLRTALHDALLDMDWTAFSVREPGEYTQRILFDTETVQRFLVDTGSKALVQILTAAGTCSALFALDLRLAAVAVLPVPALVALGVRFRRRTAPAIAAFSSDVAAVGTELSETVSGLATVRVSGCGPWRSERFAVPVRRVAGARTALERNLLGFAGATGAVVALAVSGVWLVSGLLATRGAAPGAGTLLAFLGYQAMFYGPVGWLAHLFGEFVDASVAARRIAEVLDAPRERRGGAEAPRNVREGMVLENVCFAHPDGTEVLKGVSMQLPAGETVALVGRSGIGKTTLAGLLSGFREPSSGRISVDGIPLSAIDPTAWRRRVAVVPQDPFLFRGTIRENIALGRPGVTDADVESAARAAGAHGFIAARPEGYATELGTGGVGLSGGERQRIAIARALLGNPLLVVFDEPTAALDHKTEDALRETVRRVCRGRMALVITHRTSLAMDADRVLELSEDGVHPAAAFST